MKSNNKDKKELKMLTLVYDPILGAKLIYLPQTEVGISKDFLAFFKRKKRR